MGIGRADKKWLVAHMDVLTWEISDGIISRADLITRDIRIYYMCVRRCLYRDCARARPLALVFFMNSLFLL